MSTQVSMRQKLMGFLGALPDMGLCCGLVLAVRPVRWASWRWRLPWADLSLHGPVPLSPSPWRPKGWEVLREPTGSS